jgi:hypothetical protein
LPCSAVSSAKGAQADLHLVSLTTLFLFQARSLPKSPKVVGKKEPSWGKSTVEETVMLILEGIVLEGIESSRGNRIKV